MTAPSASALAESHLIPESALAELRTLTTAALPHTCYVFRPVQTRAPGGVTRTTYQFDATLPCRVAPVRSDARVAADQVVVGREWTVVFAVNPAETLDGDVRLVVHGETDGVPWWRTMRIIRVPLERAFRTQTKVGTTDVDAAEFPVFVAVAATVGIGRTSGVGGQVFEGSGATKQAGRTSGVSTVDTTISTIVDALGDANILGLWVRGYGQSVTGGALDSWADARADSPNAGPVLIGTGTARPTVDANGRVTFDGVNDYLRASNGRILQLTAAGALVLVGTWTATASSALADLSVAGSARVLSIRNSAGFINNAGAVTTAQQAITADATVRTLHVRRSASSGGNVTAGARVTAAAEVTASGAQADQVASRLTLAANFLDTPAGFPAFICRALILYKGDYASGTQYQDVNAWAATL